MSSSLPLVGVPACRKQFEGTFHSVGEKYLTALTDGARVQPVAIPALGTDRQDLAGLLARLDGVLITGSPSNIGPHHYAGPPVREPDRSDPAKRDPARDATTLPFIRAAIAADIPLLAICRGHQELNVALGGSLHQHVHELPGVADHRMPQSDDLDIRYGPRHSVRLTTGGRLAALATPLGLDPENLTVNSLHSQAIDRLADDLTVEAVSHDGVIEAVAVANTGFALGIQWHPEYKVLEDSFSAALFTAFGTACRGHRRHDARQDDG